MHQRTVIKAIILMVVLLCLFPIRVRERTYVNPVGNFPACLEGDNSNVSPTCIPPRIELQQKRVGLASYTLDDLTRSHMQEPSNRTVTDIVTAVLAILLVSLLYYVYQRNKAQLPAKPSRK
jgi:hypothetical protein